MAECAEGVLVRNGNHPGAGSLLVSRAAMGAWLAAVRAGELDDRP